MAYDPSDAHAAWMKWWESEEGQRATNPATLKLRQADREYLINRVRRAFDAGLEAGNSLAVDDAVAKVKKLLRAAR